jgi:hypothetical protein
MNRRILVQFTPVFVSIVVLTGCIKGIQSSVPAFAQAVTLTATNVQCAFDTVQSSFYDAEALNYAANYNSTSSFDPSKLGQKWLPPEALAARSLILQGLKQYASQLSSLTVSKSGSVDTATTALSTSLKGLAGAAPFKGIAANAQVEANGAAAAINALANWLIDSKLQKDLPAAIEKMDPTIQSISQLLVADIGSVGADPEHPTRGSGLRQVLWVKYGEEVRAWDKYVRDNYLSNNVSPDAKLAAIKQIAALAAQQKTADQTLAQVAVTIKQLAQAHTELVKAAKTKQNLTADLGGLIAEGQRLNSYYQSLATGK